MFVNRMPSILFENEMHLSPTTFFTILDTDGQGTVYTLTGGHKVKRLLPHNCMDAGGRVTHGAVAERTQRKSLDRIFYDFSERQYIAVA